MDSFTILNLIKSFDLLKQWFYLQFQIAISNPNRDVLLTLTRSGVVDLIGREWYFVRVHDAVQVCLQHVQGLTNSPRKQPSFLESKTSQLLRQRPEDRSLSQLESGNFAQKDESSHLEPLLSKKPWGKQWGCMLLYLCNNVSTCFFNSFIYWFRCAHFFHPWFWGMGFNNSFILYLHD